MNLGKRAHFMTPIEIWVRLIRGISGYISELTQGECSALDMTGVVKKTGGFDRIFLFRRFLRH